MARSSNGVRILSAAIEPGATDSSRWGFESMCLTSEGKPNFPCAPSRCFSAPSSAAHRRCRGSMRRWKKIAPTDTTVLILGGDGHGKKRWAARSAARGFCPRFRSPSLRSTAVRSASRSWKASCSAHRRGAFTGATTSREGAFLSARGGTLFLDEIGELPALPPASFFSACWRHVRYAWSASDRSTPTDVRIVAATNRHLGKAVKRRVGFERDLYYRLAVVTIELPPPSRTPTRHWLARRNASFGCSQATQPSSRLASW